MVTTDSRQPYVHFNKNVNVVDGDMNINFDVTQKIMKIPLRGRGKHEPKFRNQVGLGTHLECKTQTLLPSEVPEIGISPSYVSSLDHQGHHG